MGSHGSRKESMLRSEARVGRCQNDRGEKRLFAFLSHRAPNGPRLTEQWRAMGYGEHTEVRVVTDGLCSFKNLVQRSVGKRGIHVLDWFHIAMRLNVLRKTLTDSLMRSGVSKRVIVDAHDRLRSIHRHLWHGDTDYVVASVGRLANFLEASPPRKRQLPEDLQRVCRLLRELWHYLWRYQEEIFSYSHERQLARGVSTAPVESAINSLVNHRMNKRQQMSWSARGAAAVLGIRVAGVNGDLPHALAGWWPHYHHAAANHCKLAV
jgi:hypothetical protein